MRVEDLNPEPDAQQHKDYIVDIILSARVILGCSEYRIFDAQIDQCKRWLVAVNASSES